MDHTDEETGGIGKFATIAFGSKRFTTGQMSLTMYAENFSATHLAFDDLDPSCGEIKNLSQWWPITKCYLGFFWLNIIPFHFGIFLITLHFTIFFVLAHVPGVENPSSDYQSRLQIQLGDGIHSKLTQSIPVFHWQIDIASKTPKQEDETDYYPHDEADENIP